MTQLWRELLQRILFLFCILLFLFNLEGCGTARKRSDPSSSASGGTPRTTNGDTSNGDAAIDELSNEEILKLEESTEKRPSTEPKDPLDSEGDEEDLPVSVSKKRMIPAVFNNKVADWIRYFSQKDRERFQRYLDRGEAYREVVENILEENNVPIDLYYLGLIESGFNYSAKSSAAAVGVWQFMKSTGKMYGLGVDSYVDERKDPIRATEAAAKHLRDLYREFGSWYLALSAYNAGSGRIRGAVRRGKTKDFWELVERKILPRETMEYVPKFLAARYIGDHPDLFAFYINEEKRFPDVELVKIPSPLKFSEIEQKCSIPQGTLAFVNPHYLKDFSHPAKAIDEIWVPTAYKGTVENKFESLKPFIIKVKPERIALRTPSKRVAIHIVKRGETLIMIARRQGLSVAYLKRVNGLRSSRVQPGLQLKLSATQYKQHRTHPRSSKKRKGR